MTTPTLSPKRARSSNGAARTHVRYPGTTNGTIPRGESDRFALVAVVSVMLGILVGVLGIFAIAMWFDARDAKDAAERAASKVNATADASSTLLPPALSSIAGPSRISVVMSELLQNDGP